MTKKLSRSDIDNTFDLMSRIHGLNEDLQAHGYKTVHKTTLDRLTRVSSLDINLTWSRSSAQMTFKTERCLLTSLLVPLILN